MSKKQRGNTMLLLAALIWGISFVAQKAGMEYIGPFTFNGIRFLLGTLVLVPIILVMRAKNSTTEIKKKSDKKSLIIGGISCGVVLFLASSIQQLGMVYTTAGKSGFITALYIVLVPILGLLGRKTVRPILWFCVAMATIGLYLLCIQEGFFISKGDLLVLVSAFGFAGHILAIGHFSPKADSIQLACLQFLIAGLLSIPFMLQFETIHWADIVASTQPILYAAVMSCGVAYTLQIIAQKDTSPTVASLIMSLESVIAVIAGIILLGEQVTSREVWGCVIMFAAILLAQYPSKEERLANAESRRTKLSFAYLTSLLTRVIK